MSAAGRSLAFARFYARHAWPVFPLKPQDKIPLGSLAPHGFLDASTDPDVIARWWETVPEAGIGVPTGRASGTVVLDVDPRHGGDVSLAKLEAEHGPLPETVEAITGGGGRHLVFAYPAGDLDIRNRVNFCDALLGVEKTGLDIRAEGGYIAVAPTIHPDTGQAYRWRSDRSPKTLKPAPIPDWLLVLMTAKAGSNGSGLIVRAPLDTAKILEGVPEGERDVDLWGLACKLRGADVPKEVAFELVAKAARNAKPAVEERIAYDKVNRAYLKYAPGVRGQTQEHKSPTFERVSADVLFQAAATPVEWTIRPLYTVKSVRLIGGPSKSLTTTLTLAQMLLTVKGGTLAGQFESDGGHSFIWFDAENTIRSWARKYLALCRGLGLDARELIASGRVTYINARGLYLDNDPTFDAVLDAAKVSMASEIVLDPLPAIHRQKENDAGAMRAFFTDRIFRLRDEASAGVTIRHHNRKPAPGFKEDPADALRGTTDFRAVVDTYISVSRSRKDKSRITVTVSAQRDAPEEGPFHLALDWPEDGPAVFHQAEPAEDQSERRTGRPPTARETARRVIREAMTADPDLTRTRALALCEEAGVGLTNCKAAWREVKADE